MNEMEKVLRVISFFKSQQKKAGVTDNGNALQNKWDMRTVIQEIDNDRHLKQLILFFFDTSDDKTFKCFFRRYNEYYETMLQVKEDRAHRRALARKTLERKEQIEP